MSDDKSQSEFRKFAWNLAAILLRKIPETMNPARENGNDPEKDQRK